MSSAPGTPQVGGAAQVGAAQVGAAGVQQVGTGAQQLEPQGLPHFGLQKAKKCARLLVQHDGQAEFVSQLAVQLLQQPPGLQCVLQLVWQPRRQGSKQSSERSPRRTFSSKQGFGQQRPTGGGGNGVQQVGAGSAHEVQPP